MPAGWRPPRQRRRVVYIGLWGTRTSNLSDSRITCGPGPTASGLGVHQPADREPSFDADYVAATCAASTTWPRRPGLRAEEVESLTAFRAATVVGWPRPSRLPALIPLARRQPLALHHGVQTLRAICPYRESPTTCWARVTASSPWRAASPGTTSLFSSTTAQGAGRGPEHAGLTNSMKKGDVDVLLLNSSYRRYPDCKRGQAGLSRRSASWSSAAFHERGGRRSPTSSSHALRFRERRLHVRRERQGLLAGGSVRRPARWSRTGVLPGPRAGLAPEVTEFESRAAYEMFGGPCLWRGLSSRGSSARQRRPLAVAARDEPRHRQLLCRGQAHGRDGDLDLDVKVLGQLRLAGAQGQAPGPRRPARITRGFRQGRSPGIGSSP
jgi:hypothetical protein